MAHAGIARLVSGLFALLAVVESARGGPFHVEVDTSASAGSEAVLAFDLNNTDGGYHHYVTIDGFATDGALRLCQPSDGISFCVNSPELAPAGADVVGALPSTVSIYDTDIGGSALSPITYYQNITLADLISFDFEMLGEPGSDTLNPDGFSLTLLDAKTWSPILADSILFLYSFGQGCDAGTYSNVTSCDPIQGPNGVPEPGVLTLAIASLLALGVVRWTTISRNPTFRGC